MFSDEDRKIYAYDAGQGKVYADPVAIHRKLVRAAGGDLQGVAKAACPVMMRQADGSELAAPETPEQIAERLAAEDRLLAVIREAFALPAIDPQSGQGCTDSMCYRVWADYNGYKEGERAPAGS